MCGGPGRGGGTRRSRPPVGPSVTMMARSSRRNPSPMRTPRSAGIALYGNRTGRRSGRWCRSWRGARRGAAKRDALRVCALAGNGRWLDSVGMRSRAAAMASACLVEDGRRPSISSSAAPSCNARGRRRRRAARSAPQFTPVSVDHLRGSRLAIRSFSRFSVSVPATAASTMPFAGSLAPLWRPTGPPRTGCPSRFRGRVHRPPGRRWRGVGSR